MAGEGAVLALDRGKVVEDARREARVAHPGDLAEVGLGGVGDEVPKETEAFGDERTRLLGAAIGL